MSSRFARFVTELGTFALKNALSCLFPALIFACLALLRLVHLPYFHRYDAMLVACVGIQVWMVTSGLETKDELKVITLFHLLGLFMELHKVHIGSWAYPEPALTKVGGVPLYSGFMYASVASFMCQAWRRLDLKFHAWPRRLPALVLGIAIYANFMSNHYIADLRWPLIGAVAVLFHKTSVEFTCAKVTRRMPMILAFLLIAGFIWLGENMGTFLGAWRYPYQQEAWHPVQIDKLSSWFLLAIVSLVIVGELKMWKKDLPATAGYPLSSHHT